MRGRLTLTDVVYLLFALAALAGLYPVYDDLLGSATGMSAGAGTAFATLLPAAALVMLAIVFVEARSG